MKLKEKLKVIKKENQTLKNLEKMHKSNSNRELNNRNEILNLSNNKKHRLSKNILDENEENMKLKEKLKVIKKENQNLKNLEKMHKLNKYNNENNMQKNRIIEDNDTFPPSNNKTNKYDFNYTGNNYAHGYSYYHPSTWNYENNKFKSQNNKKVCPIYMNNSFGDLLPFNTKDYILTENKVKNKYI